MSGIPELVVEEAARWHVASLADDCDWDGFTRWLESDPLHARAYDEVALADGMAREAGPRIADLPANDDEWAEPIATPRRWPLWAGGAIAASLALALAVDQFEAPSPQTYATRSDRREIALTDGSSVVLAPQSRLTVDGNDLTLDGGGYFAIRHDPARRMVVHAGGIDVTDIGTVFDVQSGPDATRIAVADGKLTIRGDALDTPIALDAGKRFLLESASHIATVSTVARDDVGSWRRGQLSFVDAPLAIVATDLQRYTHTKTTVPAELKNVRFSGTLSVAHGEAAVRDLAQLMGLAAVKGADGYRLQPGS